MTYHAPTLFAAQHAIHERRVPSNGLQLAVFFIYTHTGAALESIFVCHYSGVSLALQISNLNWQTWRACRLH